MQCLEYDISAQASDIESVKQEFLRLLEARVEVAQELNISDPFGKLSKAPRHFFDMYNSGDHEQDAPKVMANLDQQCIAIKPIIRFAHELAA